MRFGGLLHLLENKRADLAGAVGLALGGNPGVAVVRLDDPVGDEFHVLLRHGIINTTPDEALDRKQGGFGVGHGLTLGGLSDEAFAAVAESDHRRCRTHTFRILDHARAAAIHDSHTRIGRAKIDADNFAHDVNSMGFGGSGAKPCFRHSGTTPLSSPSR